ncbi:site-specific DNA-methyltransferase [Neisseriaceae bacterium B1]
MHMIKLPEIFSGSLNAIHHTIGRNYDNRTEPNRTEPNRTEIITNNQTLINEKLQQIKQLFPEIFCENQIDFEKLKLILGADNLCDSNERYQLNWAGKTAAYRALQTPTFNTLIPCPAESVDFDTTQNVFIEAENMEALKILQKAYAGSVKMIYIDPPYNTGKDSFIYPDKFSETRDEYAKRVGDKDTEGYLKRDGVFQGALRQNSKDSGYYHSNWLNMMLPRLHLAKTLLSEDGVIFISIDDNEQAQLKLLCDEVFGAENFYGMASWIATTKAMNAGSAKFKTQKSDEYIYIYGKIPLQEHSPFRLEVKEEKEYPLVKNGRKYRVEEIQQRKNTGIKRSEKMVFPILGVYPRSGNRWTIGSDTAKELEKLEDVFIKNNTAWRNIYADDEVGESHYPLWINFSDTVGTSETGKATVFNLFQQEHGFETVKPVELIEKLIFHFTDDDSIVLDFFTGSGTTAQAVMNANIATNGNRRFIAIQLPEIIKEDNKEAIELCNSLNIDRNIAEIAKERIRRAGSQISGSLKDNQSVDTGFKVFKLAESNFKQWQNPQNREVGDLVAQMEHYQDVVAPHALPENMAYELALRLGFQLTDCMEYSGSVYWLSKPNGSRKTALLLETFSADLLQNVLAKSPVKVFALDKIFAGNDAMKANAALQCKDAGVVFETL